MKANNMTTTRTQIISRGFDEYGLEILVEVAKPTWREVKRYKIGDYLYIEITGLTRYMKRGFEDGLANFGLFIRSGRNVVYSTMYQDGNHVYSDNELLSEMLDDIDLLQVGQINWMH